MSEVDEVAERVYNIERSFAWWTEAPILPTVDHAFEYLRPIISSRSWRSKYKVQLPLMVDFDQSTAYDGCYFSPGLYPDGYRCYGKIALAPTGRRISVLVHELAHYVAFTAFGHDSAHGKKFTLTYIHLLGDFVNSGLAELMARHFIEEGLL